MISASVVKELRDRTGSGMMACKKALTEADGDIDKAIEILREKGLATAAKKSGRIASEGVVATFVAEDKKTASIVEVNCETDFASANTDFLNLAKNTAKMAAVTNASTIEELAEEKYVGDESIALKDAVTALIGKIGENTSLRRFRKLHEDNGMIQSYTHGGGRIGVLVQVKCDTVNDVVAEAAKDVAMQVAAASPLYLNENSVDQESLDKEREIYKVQTLNEGKPEKIADKIVEGKIKKYLKETCLVDQLWVKNSDLTISQYLAEKSKEVGSTIEIVDFVRFEKGEGIEKKEENFAEEVMKQMQQK